MSGIPVDFDKLLGFKLVVRALHVQQSSSAAENETEAERVGLILRAKIGLKPVTCLRFLED